MKTGLTNRLKKAVTVIVILLFFSPTLHLAANDGVLGITPEGVYPITQSDISMESEEIIIKMTGYSEAEVSCRFEFKNHGDAQTVLMGFPARLDEEIDDLTPEEAITVRGFTARDEKGDLPVTLIDTIPNPPMNKVSGMEIYTKWYSFSVDFNKNGKKTLYHTYKVSFSHYSTGDIFAGYVLETGSLWYGTIGHSKVVFDLGEHPVYSVTEVYPNNFFKLEGNKLIFERTNFKPTYNLSVTINGYHYSEDWIKMLEESGNIEELDEIQKRIEFFSTKPEDIRKNSPVYLQQYEGLITKDQVKALFIKSALGLPDGSEKPQIIDCDVTEELLGHWRFLIRGTDPDMDIVSCHAEINGLNEYRYISDDYQHGTVNYSHAEKCFHGRGYLITAESKPFSITYIMTDAAGNTDTETIILNARTYEPAPTGIPEAGEINLPDAAADEGYQDEKPGTGGNGIIPASQTNEGAENKITVTRGRLIHTEEEIVPMLVVGAVIVLVAFLVMVIVFLLKKRNPGYLLFIGQIACLAIGLYEVVRLLTMTDEGTTMASENISLGIGLTAVAWAISMLFMAGGIILTGKNSRETKPT